jgi:hypothetical protein
MFASNQGDEPSRLLFKGSLYTPSDPFVCDGLRSQKKADDVGGGQVFDYLLLPRIRAELKSQRRHSHVIADGTKWANEIVGQVALVVMID